MIGSILLFVDMNIIFGPLQLSQLSSNFVNWIMSSSTLKFGLIDESLFKDKLLPCIQNDNVDIFASLAFVISLIIWPEHNICSLSIFTLLTYWLS